MTAVIKLKRWPPWRPCSTCRQHRMKPGRCCRPGRRGSGLSGAGQAGL